MESGEVEEVREEDVEDVTRLQVFRPYAQTSSPVKVAYETLAGEHIIMGVPLQSFHDV